ncbi:hypothetical protein D3C85_555320 [compost metagenome]
MPSPMTWFSTSRSIARSNAWRTRLSLAKGLLARAPLPRLTEMDWKPSPVTGASRRLGSSLTALASLGATRSMMSRSPARRLFRRTVVSGIGV